ncbi:hypothetical protein Nepgr_017282 [Nepenthes gracilis]|uniref:Uncharacterized protein n=1 Tax=Nepenthes gracilis TaxID=150966 RepID=A0AAD3SSA7_NEPGR|nr:hypothetical protein Nepgr_017282 [Nepenthes gracilis]
MVVAPSLAKITPMTLAAHFSRSPGIEENYNGSHMAMAFSNSYKSLLIDSCYPYGGVFAGRVDGSCVVCVYRYAVLHLGVTENGVNGRDVSCTVVLLS